ncbi:glycine cleavage system protein GcvH [Candidatus Nitronereus thalassa]|uniref:Glycine cleavage system H protein n=1 Tax=Candidatus Nitronereus thalassa TaxID=3020898 RepID=A0ABU3K4F2_9BACT|nr:glycine cleavage system protein GcvH [Candidatus Nitronereus thalassa]MDT7041279.1 glycine cleavage system protein GcvH [Candidatus Nitronereus thalassa]
MIPSELRYHKEHEWVRQEGTTATIGISDFAQDALGDVVFVDLPKVDAVIARDQEIGEVESTKATSSIYSPVNGKIVKVNEELQDHPEYLNSDPYGQGWIAVVELSNPGDVEDLMTASQYEEFLSSQS